jgi:uncharacterized integral membrane protein
MSSVPPVSPSQVSGSQPPTDPPPQTTEPATTAPTDAKPARAASQRGRKSPLRFTRTAATWSALIVGFLILIVLLVFIAQNTEPARLAFLGWHWSLPLGVAILLAAVSGGLLTTLAGTARIFQLRRAVKKSLKAQ